MSLNMFMDSRSYPAGWYISPFIANNIIKKKTLIHKCKALKYGIRIKYYSTIRKKCKK
jgi:hypothetical protein